MFKGASCSLRKLVDNLKKIVYIIVDSVPLDKCSCCFAAQQNKPLLQDVEWVDANSEKDLWLKINFK